MTWNSMVMFPITTLVHPLWNSNLGDGHDPALLWMAPGDLGAPPIQVGAPWDPGAYAAGTLATIKGYGRTSANGPSSYPDLLAADTIVQSDDYMNDIFNPWYWFDDWRSSLMIGAGTTYQTASFGDSGGPLVVSRNGRPVQVGVFSFVSTRDGDGCNAAAGFAEQRRIAMLRTIGLTEAARTPTT